MLSDLNNLLDRTDAAVRVFLVPVLIQFSAIIVILEQYCAIRKTGLLLQIPQHYYNFESLSFIVYLIKRIYIFVLVHLVLLIKILLINSHHSRHTMASDCILFLTCFCAASHLSNLEIKISELILITESNTKRETSSVCQGHIYIQFIIVLIYQQHKIVEIFSCLMWQHETKTNSTTLWQIKALAYTVWG